MKKIKNLKRLLQIALKKKMKLKIKLLTYIYISKKK